MDEKAVADLFVDFYAWLFTTSKPTNLDRVLTGVQSVVDDSMNAALTKLYVREEVDVSIKQMALGPDGVPPIFYQNFWPDIGLEISNAVLSCLNYDIFLKSINHTFITLIPSN